MGLLTEMPPAKPGITCGSNCRFLTGGGWLEGLWELPYVCCFNMDGELMLLTPGFSQTNLAFLDTGGPMSR